MSTSLDAEIERLNTDLEQEIALRDALEKSTGEVEVNVIELDKKLLENSGDAENEWRQKYELQFETNAQLEHQLTALKEKMNELIKLDSPDSDRNNNAKLSDTSQFFVTQLREHTIAKSLDNADLRNMIRQLEREKRTLEGKLKDLEWRLDSESQELFRVNEEKKKYQLELNQASLSMDNARIHAKSPILMSPLPGVKFQRAPSRNDLKNRQYGIPDNHRILDPRKGPVKKVAAVKKLPKITNTSVDAVFNESKAKRKTTLQKKKNERKIKSSEQTVDSMEHARSASNETV